LEVLRGVSVGVAKGEVAAIIGPSGSGKSTFLRCLNGLESFDAGEIHVDDLVLRPNGQHNGNGSLLRDLRRRVGMVFQQFQLFPHMSVLDNVVAGPIYAQGRLRKDVEPEACRLLERVGLAEKLHSRPDHLSGGQQQRVAIARALAVRPEYMLFDEPTSALDPRMAREVFAVITDLAHDGQTMVVVTHALSFAKEVARTVHVMNEGQVAESGPPEQIFDAPDSPVTKEFLAAVNGK
jgi:ABC-type polar amino acid transport system ATPase subunit